ncbi:Globin [Trinorchestia longiramus]|nr:Globin [Trinorchestia longiramus]
MGGAHSRDSQNNQIAGNKTGVGDRPTPGHLQNNKKMNRDEILGPKPEDITEEEKAMIRETWHDVETSVAKVGVVMFAKLFETHPDVQESFMSFRGVALQEIQQSKQLKNHALRVMGFVQKAVARLDEPEKMKAIADELGAKHGTYGVYPAYIDLIGPQFIMAMQCSLESRWESQVEDAWLKLFQSVAYVMKSAMLDQASNSK